jgi:subfamily B ATP-binding cassette protein MsbA
MVQQSQRALALLGVMIWTSWQVTIAVAVMA